MRHTVISFHNGMPATNIIARTVVNKGVFKLFTRRPIRTSAANDGGEFVIFQFLKLSAVLGGQNAILSSVHQNSGPFKNNKHTRIIVYAAEEASVGKQNDNLAIFFCSIYQEDKAIAYVLPGDRIM